MLTILVVKNKTMGYKSAAQRKAVHANRADGGKGHPDNKKGPGRKLGNNALSTLKSRMSGPAQTDMSSPVYGFDTGRKPSSGVDAVNAGLAAAANQVTYQSNAGQDMANLGSTIGQAIGIAYGKNKEEKRLKIKPATTLKPEGIKHEGLVGDVTTEKINTGVKSPFGITLKGLDDIRTDLPTQMLKPKK